MSGREKKQTFSKENGQVFSLLKAWYENSDKTG